MIEVVRCATTTQQIKEGGGDYYNLKECSMEGQVNQQESININRTRDERDYHKYQKLKRNFKELREEYLKVLENWEESSKTIKSLTSEQKFLREKLEYFLTSKNMSDEALTEAIVEKHQEIELEKEEKAKQAIQKQQAQAASKLENGIKGNNLVNQQDHSRQTQFDQVSTNHTNIQVHISQQNQGPSKGQYNQSSKGQNDYPHQSNQVQGYNQGQQSVQHSAGYHTQSKHQNSSDQLPSKEPKKERKSQHSSSYAGQDAKIHIQQQFNSNGQYQSQPQTKRKKKDHNQHPQSSYSNSDIGGGRISNQSKGYHQGGQYSSSSSYNQNYNQQNQGGPAPYANQDQGTLYSINQQTQPNMGQGSQVYFSTSGSQSMAQSSRNPQVQQLSSSFTNGQNGEATQRSSSQVYGSVSNYSPSQKAQRSSSSFSHQQNFQQHQVYEQSEIHSGASQNPALRYQSSNNREDQYSIVGENFSRQRNGEGNGMRGAYSHAQNPHSQGTSQPVSNYGGFSRQQDQNFRGSSQEKHFLEGDQGQQNQQYPLKIEPYDYNYNNNQRIQHDH